MPTQSNSENRNKSQAAVRESIGIHLLSPEL